MIVSWMGHMLLVSALLALAACAAEHALRLYRLPTRFIWALALAGSVVLPFMVHARTEPVAPAYRIGIEEILAADATPAAPLPCAWKQKPTKPVISMHLKLVPTTCTASSPSDRQWTRT
jgi:hypothetical protein